MSDNLIYTEDSNFLKTFEDKTRGLNPKEFFMFFDSNEILNTDKIILRSSISLLLRQIFLSNFF